MNGYVPVSGTLYPIRGPNFPGLRIGIIGVGSANSPSPMGRAVAIHLLEWSKETSCLDSLLLNNGPHANEVVEKELTSTNVKVHLAYAPVEEIVEKTDLCMISLDATRGLEQILSHRPKTRIECLSANLEPIIGLAKKFKGYTGNVLMVTNPVDILTQVFAVYSSLPVTRVNGLTFVNTKRLQDAAMRAVKFTQYEGPIDIGGCCSIGPHDKTVVPLISKIRFGIVPLYSINGIEGILENIAESARSQGTLARETIGNTTISASSAAKDTILHIMQMQDIPNMTASVFMDGLYIGYPIEVIGSQVIASRHFRIDNAKEEEQFRLEETLSRLQEGKLIIDNQHARFVRATASGYEWGESLQCETKILPKQVPPVPRDDKERMRIVVGGVGILDNHGEIHQQTQSAAKNGIVRIAYVTADEPLQVKVGNAKSSSDPLLFRVTTNSVHDDRYLRVRKILAQNNLLWVEAQYAHGNVQRSWWFVHDLSKGSSTRPADPRTACCPLQDDYLRFASEARRSTTVLHADSLYYLPANHTGMVVNVAQDGEIKELSPINSRIDGISYSNGLLLATNDNLLHYVDGHIHLLGEMQDSPSILQALSPEHIVFYSNTQDNQVHAKQLDSTKGSTVYKGGAEFAVDGSDGITFAQIQDGSLALYNFKSPDEP